MTPTVVPVTRHLGHVRRITCEAYARDDGLWDVEGSLIDTKPVPLQLPTGALEPGQAIHHMNVRMTVDVSLVIHAVQARTLHGPYETCPEINARYELLVGTRIAPGFNATLKRLFGGVRGCSHITEMLPQMATVAYQVLYSEWATSPTEEKLASTPLGGCHALRLDGPMVMRYFPNSHTPRSKHGR